MKNLPSVPVNKLSELNELLLKSGEISNFTAKERVKYVNDMTTQRDIENQIAYAMEKGMEKKNIEIAKKLKNLGVKQDTIREATGLSQEQIAAL